MAIDIFVPRSKIPNFKRIIKLPWNFYMVYNIIDLLWSYDYPTKLICSTNGHNTLNGLRRDLFTFLLYYINELVTV